MERGKREETGVRLTGSDVVEIMGNQVDYSKAEKSFSPFYSDIGLGFDENPGIQKLYLHFNRCTSEIGAPFLALPIPELESEKSLLGVRQFHGDAEVRYAFYDHDAWLIEAKHVESVKIHAAARGMTEPRSTTTKSGTILLEGYLPAGDDRDPDPLFPVCIGVHVYGGRVKCGDGLTEPMVIEPDGDGSIKAAFAVAVSDISYEEIEEKLLAAPAQAQEARRMTAEWFGRAVGNPPCGSDRPDERKALAKAVTALIFNSSKAPGYLKGRIASFPNRGGYPTHYLWDACFQNLAEEYMDPRLAEDALLLLTENLCADGKMPQFLCSTWARPKAAQPPLAGWAALRLVRQRNDIRLAKKVLEPLKRNTRWWLTHRMTRYGIIGCPDPMETGWDDTPRLDRGPILACDMNSYLLLQMRAVSELSELAGDSAGAEEYRLKAENYAKNMVKLLYDEETNLFREVLIDTGEKLAIKTPACFLPLLADVPINDEAARDMLQRYLLNPDCFFGSVPFPSVSYDDPEYHPDAWWRGPTWISVAYLMLEILKKYGYRQEYLQSAETLYRMVVKDGEIRELFDSRTGAGLGNYEQGWTASILIRLNMELREEGVLL